MSRLSLLSVVLLLAACEGTSKSGSGGGVVGEGLEAADGDGDGFLASDDCNDSDSSINSGAVEVCDGLDNDCDGEVDEGVADVWYQDLDGDGFGDPATEELACEGGDGRVANADDCADSDPDSHPGAAERCDGVDNDCDGVLDEDLVSVWYADRDGDGHGDPEAPLDDCDPEPGFVASADDCDDAEPLAFPGGDEVCDEIDNDCDELVDEDVSITFYADRDGDGYGVFHDTTDACSLPEGYAANPEDCDDATDAVNPAASEVCNGIDDDCDGDLDEDSAIDARTWHSDADGDGFGDPSFVQVACVAPVAFVADGTDCDDANLAINPDATEICNSLDDDCDGRTDDGDPSLDTATGTTYFTDADRDGYGSPSGAVQACVQPTGSSVTGDDCDDGNNRIHPGASEVCNGLDDDCDVAVDDADASLDRSTGSLFYGDADADGYGSPSSPVAACLVPAGAATNALDCDDGRYLVNPAASEICNGLDDDCDTNVDDADSSVDVSTGLDFYRDLDSDGYGSPSGLVEACSQPSGTVTNALDCNDAAGTVNPGATEVCNGIDDDCDLLSDDADGGLDRSTGTLAYEDADRDGYGWSATTDRFCVVPSGWSTTGGDCDESRASINPGASEICNGRDDDCDGLTDDADASVDTSSSSLSYRDADGDGYGTPGTSARYCVRPSGWSAIATDCDDALSAVNPAASELCNGRDDDCDSTVDEATAADALTWYRDFDSDGYGNPSSTTRACTLPSGYLSSAGDCDDTQATVYPGADETCNSRDDDCDGTADESWYALNFSSTPSAVMQLNGSTVVVSGFLELTNSGGGTGTAFFYEPVPGPTWEISFRFATGGGSGADGLALVFLDSADYSLIGGSGGGLGYTGLPGYAFEIDTYYNGGVDPDENHVAVVDAATQANFAVSSSVPEFEDTGWHTAVVRYDSGRVRGTIDGSLVIDTTVSGYGSSEFLIGFTAATGGATNYHQIDDVDLGCP